MTITELIDQLRIITSKHGEMEVCCQKRKGHYPIIKLFVDRDVNDSEDDYLVIESELMFDEGLNG